MDFGLTEEQRMLKNSARDFFDKECPKSFVKEMMKDAQGYSPSMWKKMANLGWLGLAYEEKYGGGDGSFLDLATLTEEMGRALLPGPFYATVVQVGLTIAAAGNEDQKKKYLSAIAKGELLATLALLEADCSYPLEHVTTTAQNNGDHYLISGTKVFVPDAHIANLIICPATTNSSLTLFAIDAKTPGITITPQLTMSGDKLSEIKFSKVKVTKDNILGKAGEGKTYLEKAIPKMVVAQCAAMVGGAQQTLEMTIQYIKERKQFGRPLGSFQALQHYSADMVTDVEGSRHVTSVAAWMLSEGLECRKEVAIAKAWCSEAFKRVTIVAHQMHGGIGFTEEHNLHLYYKKAKAWELLFGDADLHRETVAQEMGLS